MSVELPDVYRVDVEDVAPITVESVGPVGPVTVEGIPDTYHFNVDNLAKIEIGVDPLTTNVNVGPLQILPLDLSVRLREIPSVRTHLPADFSVGVTLMGMEMAKVRLCGEAQVITEPYEPNPCEICGPRDPGSTQPTPVPIEPGATVPAGVLEIREA